MKNVDDATINRWAQIIEWSAEDLDTLHQRENSRQRHLDELGVKGKRLPYSVEDTNYIVSKEQECSMSPFWALNIPIDERMRRFDQFRRSIYPIWKPIHDRWKATWDNKDCQEYIKVLHEIDLQMWKRAPKIERGVSIRDFKRERVDING